MSRRLKHKPFYRELAEQEAQAQAAEPDQTPQRLLSQEEPATPEEPQGATLTQRLKKLLPT